MNRKGHIGLTLLIVSPFVFLVGVYAGIQWAAILLGSALLADRIPDKDQTIPFLSHRGVTHTIPFALLVSSLFAGLLVLIVAMTETRSALPGNPLPLILARLDLFAFVFFGFGLGFASHLVGDSLIEAYDFALTPLWPLSRRSFALGWATAETKAMWDWGLFFGGLMMIVVSGLGVRVIRSVAGVI